ncbi:MAG: ABC transporter substrate-binding protein [Candidatus Enterenecus sp.]
MKNAKKLLALLLALVMCIGLLAGCSSNTPANSNNPDASASPSESQPVAPATYTYQDSVSTMATNWNPHTYQTTDDSYPAEFLRSGLYSFIFNDELHPVEGKDPYEGYVIVPEMAASEPVDVTEQVKAEHPEFGIPESATAGYAYTIDLNPDCVWEDGTPINADTYVYSMQQLLNPDLLNYRASDYYAGNFCIAGAEAYANAGHEALTDNALGNFYAMADLTKGDDGVYYGPDGEKMYIGLNYALDWTGGNTLKDYVDAYGEDYFDVTNWETLVGMMDDRGLIPLTDENLALFTPVTCGNPAWGETEDDLPNYFVTGVEMPEVEYDGTVGLYKTGEYQITLVLGKSLAGFNLLYNLSGNWIVYQPYYDACLSESNGVWTSTYNTSVETTMSYGPYKLTQYQTDKFMKFERNENWWGYTDGKHTYVDPEDGQTYDMYMTDIIECEVVAEAATRKLMFLKGELMAYGLQSEDFAQYRNSDYVYFTPAETIFFLILNGHKEAITNREAAADFDQSTTDLETMLLPSFRSALAVTYDKELFAATVSPARSGAYGIIGTAYVYDPDTGARYRDTDQAKQVLCDFYSVDVSKFDSLDDAVASITGYDPETAKVLYNQAFQDALDAGYITDNDGDGVSDQTVTIEYCISSDSDFMTQTIDYLNEKMAEVTAGTGFEGKIVFTKSAPYGNDWSNKIRSGLADTVLGGWSGSALDPFGLTDLYVNPSYQYDAAWFDSTTVIASMTIDGEEITMNLRQWSDALNGATVSVDGKEYNFGDGIADVETRLDILAMIEGEILKTGNYLPMLQNASAALLSQQVYYVVDEYNPVMGRGGITYLKYNYSDAEWTAYVASQGGELTY